MIDLVKLSDRRLVFGFFARQLSYPDKSTFQDMGAIAEMVSPPISEWIETYWEKMQQLSLDEIEEQYVQTFDFQKRSTLYMTYAKFEDAKERGQLLAKLKTTYEMYGLEISNSELPDYLPLMCEFLYAADWLHHPRAEESFQTLLAAFEDGTYGLMQALEKYHSPYFYLVKALRETCKQCLLQEVEVYEHD